MWDNIFSEFYKRRDQLSNQQALEKIEDQIFLKDVARKIFDYVEVADKYNFISNVFSTVQSRI